MLIIPSLWTFAFSVMVFAPSVTDMSQRRIPNGLTLIISIFGILFNGHNGGPPGLLDAAGGLLLSASLFLSFYVMGGVGGGDVKLAAGFGSLVGLRLAPFLLASSLIYLGVWSLIEFCACRRHWTFFFQVSHALRTARAERRTLPMAPLLALGAMSADILSFAFHRFFCESAGFNYPL